MNDRLVGMGRKSRNVPLMSKTVKHLEVYLMDFNSSGNEAPLFYSLLDGKPHRLSTNSISLVLKTAADIARQKAAPKFGDTNIIWKREAARKAIYSPD